MVVIGHVDAGKSTIMGHLLHLTGYVDRKTIHKYEREAKAKGSLHYHYTFFYGTIIDLYSMYIKERGPLPMHG